MNISANRMTLCFGKVCKSFQRAFELLPESEPAKTIRRTSILFREFSSYFFTEEKKIYVNVSLDVFFFSPLIFYLFFRCIFDTVLHHVDGDRFADFLSRVVLWSIHSNWTYRRVLPNSTRILGTRILYIDGHHIDHHLLHDHCRLDTILHDSVLLPRIRMGIV